MAETVDVVVVGMGPGGEAAAAALARAGLSVLAIESRLVGGECPYYGCIPSKMMVRAANALAEARRVPRLAGDARVSPDFGVVAQRIRQEATDNWNDQAAVDRFEKAGGRLVRGRAKLLSNHLVQVGDQEFIARRAIILNTGTDPTVPPIPGLADTPFWTNRDAVATTEAPSSLIVLGGGAIGLELGQAFARFGSQVQVVEAAPQILPGEEPESADLLAGVLAAEGIGVHTGVKVDAVHHDGGRFTLTGGDLRLNAQQLLVATGRRSDFASLGLASIGVDTTQRYLSTDAYLQVAEGVYAIGDITGKGAFTHISMYQSQIVTQHILGQPGPGGDYHAVPRVTFTDPEVGAVGLTEKQARDQGLPVATAVSRIPDSSRGFIHGVGNEGFIKLVADAERRILVGATSVGPTGGEVLSMLTLAVQERVPLDHLQRMIYAYPTFHRAVEDGLTQLSQELSG